MKFTAAACIAAACFFMLALPVITGRSAAALEQDNMAQLDDTVAAPGTPIPYKTPTNDLSVSWSWTASATDEEVAYEYAFVAAGEQPATWTQTVSTSVSITAPTEGAFRLYVRTVTDTGVRSDAVVGEVMIDTTPPTVSIETPASLTVGNKADIRGLLKDFTDMTLTIGSRVYTLTNGAYDAQTGIFTISIATTGFAPGSYEIALFARDAAGNAAMATTQLKIVAPVVPVGTTTPPAPVVPRQPASVPAAINPAAVHEVARAAAPIDKDQVTGGPVASTQAPVASPVESTIARAINSDANQGRFVGLAWYWWLLAVGGLSAGIWWVRRLTKQQKLQNA